VFYETLINKGFVNYDKNILLFLLVMLRLFSIFGHEKIISITYIVFISGYSRKKDIIAFEKVI